MAGCLDSIVVQFGSLMYQFFGLASRQKRYTVACFLDLDQVVGTMRQFDVTLITNHIQLGSLTVPAALIFRLLTFF